MLRALTAATLTLLAALPALAQQQPPSRGDPAPELSLAAYISAPADAPQTLAALKGKVVVLEFWATWCAPCIAAIPHLNALAETTGPDVVFISITDEERGRIETFLSKRPMKSWVALDKDRATFSAYGVRMRPHTVVIGPDGRIAAITSPESLTEAALRDVLAGKPVALPLKADRPPTFDWQSAADLSSESPAALAHAVLQRSDSTGGASKSLPGSGRIEADGVSWRVVVQLAHGLKASQVVGDVPALADQVFRISVLAPSGRDEDAKAMLRSLVEPALGIRVQPDEQEQPVLVLSRKPGAPEPPPSTSAETRSTARLGRITVQRGSPARLAERIAGFAGGLIAVDETGLRGEYDFTLEWNTGDPASLHEALGAMGLQIKKERRRVPVVVVTPAEEPTGR